jgi:hypothetical protein
MEIGLIQESLITRDFEVLDEAGTVIDILTVTWDRNLFTGNYDRRQAEMYAARVKDVDSLIAKRYPTLPRPSHGGRRKRKPRSRKGAPLRAEFSPEEEATLAEAAEADTLLTAEEPGAEDFLGKAVEQYVSQKEIDAVLNDLAREIIADSLALDRYGVVKRWSMTRQTRPVEPIFKELLPLPLPFLSELQEFLKGESLPKVARTLRVRTTSDSTEDGSPLAQPIQTPESPTM